MKMRSKTFELHILIRTRYDTRNADSKCFESLEYIERSSIWHENNSIENDLIPHLCCHIAFVWKEKSTWILLVNVMWIADTRVNCTQNDGKPSWV